MRPPRSFPAISDGAHPDSTTSPASTNNRIAVPNLFRARTVRQFREDRYMSSARNYSKTPALNVGLFPPGVARTAVGGNLRIMQSDIVTAFAGVPVSVTDYGAVGDGVTDDGPAFNLASAALTTAGKGTLIIPPGAYMLATQWTSPYAQTGNMRISAYGAEIFTTGAISGLYINSGGSPHGLTLDGLTVNARNNTTQMFGIDVKFSTNVVINDCCVEGHNTRAGYAGLRIGPTDITNDSTNSYWTIVRGFRTRSRAGELPLMENAIMLYGAANSTVIRDCNFASVYNGVKMISTGGTTTIANGVLIDGNAFEGTATGIYIGAGSTVDGLRLTNNRGESISTGFLDLTNMNTAVNTPIWKAGNYFVSSVVADVINPSNILINNFDFGITPDFGVDRTLSGADSIRISSSSTGGALKLRYNGAKALNIQGGTGVDLAYWGQRSGSGSSLQGLAGLFATNFTASSSGVEVRNPNGTATFVAVTSVAVAFGVAEADALYKIIATAEGNAGAPWITAKTTIGFNLNVPATFTGAVNWKMDR